MTQYAAQLSDLVPTPHLLGDDELRHIIPSYLSPAAKNNMAELCQAYFNLCYEMQTGHFQPKFPGFRQLRKQHAISNCAEILREQEAMLLGSQPIERLDSLYQPMDQREARTQALRDLARPIIAAVEELVVDARDQTLAPVI